MAAHIVKCPYCSENFDTNKVPFIQIGRRYAHQSCYDEAGGKITYLKKAQTKEKKEKGDSELDQLKSYINNLYGEKANWPMIMKQIKDYQKLGYTLSGIEKSLKYFYEIQHNNPEQSNGGIGIVAYTYSAAYQYYLDIYLTNQNNENKTLSSAVKEYIIKIPESKRLKRKLLPLGEEV